MVRPGHKYPWLIVLNGTLMAHAGVSPPLDRGTEVGIRSRRRACLEAGLGSGSSWSTRRAERAGPRPQTCYTSVPTRRDTRALRDPPLSCPVRGAIPEQGPPEARDCLILIG